MHAMSRLLWIAATIVYFLVLGFLTFVAEGFIPTTLRQVLLVLFIGGPLLLLGEAIAEGLLAIVGYAAGRVLLPIITCGMFRAERYEDFMTFPWHGVARAGDGKYVVSDDATGVFGLLILVALIAAGTVAYVAYW